MTTEDIALAARFGVEESDFRAHVQARHRSHIGRWDLAVLDVLADIMFYHLYGRVE